MANKHAVVRTDLMYATDVRSGLVSVKYMGKDGSAPAEIDNGHVVLLHGLDGDEREIYLGTDVKKDSDVRNIALIASPEVMYDERMNNLEDYYNEADKPLRGYLLHNGDIFSVTKEALTGDNDPAVGDTVELADGTQLKFVKSATEDSTTIGKIIEVAMAGRHKYYAIEIDTSKIGKEIAPIGHYAVPDPDMTKDFGNGFGKTADFLEPDVHIDWAGTTGAVLGTIKYVAKNDKFQGDEAKGNYYPVVLSDYYKNKDIEIHGKTVKDTEIIFYLGNVMNENKIVTIKCDNELIANLDFSRATLQTEPAKV